MILLALPLLVNGPLDAYTAGTDPLPLYSAYGLQYAQGVPPPGMPPPPPRGLQWHEGQVIMQGFFGVNEYDTMKVKHGNVDIDGSGEDSAELPTIGGGAQFKLGGKRIDFGLELMFSFAWRANATAIAVGSGGAAVAVDISTFTTELYGGPFANLFLGDKARIYASVGPMLQWASYDQDAGDFGVVHDSGSGFGTGFYARTGIEFMLTNRSMLGLGVRWSESEVDLGSTGDLELDGIQWALTVSHGF
jgi:hypothetical protein